MLACQNLARCQVDVDGSIDQVEAWRANPEPHRSVRIYHPEIVPDGAAARAHGAGAVWILDFEPFPAPTVGRLPGWPTALETALPAALSFASCDQAVGYARRQGWYCTVLQPVFETAAEPEPDRRRASSIEADPVIVSLAERNARPVRFPRVFP